MKDGLWVELNLLVMSGYIDEGAGVNCLSSHSLLPSEALAFVFASSCYRLFICIRCFKLGPSSA